MSFLQSEVVELERELELLSSNADADADDNDDDDRSSRMKRKTSTGVVASRNRDAMVSELGDVLFDALLLEATVRRAYGLTEEDAWEKACEKVERRTPYMMEWGNGKSIARNREEAIFLWNEVKGRENKVEKHTKHPPRKEVSWISRWSKSRFEIGNIQSTAIGFVAGLLAANLFRHR